MKTFLLAGLLACVAAAIAEDDTTMAVNYLNKFHYISQSRSGNHNVKRAIQNFQRFAGLPVTGELDQETIAQMKMPRCGDPDVDESGTRIRRYALGTKWPKRHLTYHISYGADLPESTQNAVFAKALKYWVDVSGLTFSKTSDGSSADFKISFGADAHAGPNDKDTTCNYPFDGPGKVLAHAFFPDDGRSHFDEAESFTDGTSSGTNLLWVATHEFGHALGLEHSDVRDAVMYPYYTGYVPGFSLHADDVNGIRALYGDINGAGVVCQDLVTECPNWKSWCSSWEYARTNCMLTCGTC